jgi:isoleucyl-tRNA synthetase
MLTKEDFVIEPVSNTGYSSSSDNGISVGITTELSESLIQEGIVRDIIRQVQILRKEAGFEVEDRIQVFTDWHPDLKPSILKHEQYFCSETLAVSLDVYSQEKEFLSHIDFNGNSIPIAINRINKN